MTEALGTRIRQARRRLGLTLDELAGRTGISKPYLSLIETGRVSNPPADAKLRSIETALAFTPGELVSHANWQRTPSDVRRMLLALMNRPSPEDGTPRPDPSLPAGMVDLDAAHASGVLARIVESLGGNVESVAVNAVPIINKVSAGYPSDFTDLAYPRGHADAYAACPDVEDPDAFAARVHGDSMAPKYAPGDVVIFSPAANPRSGDDCFVRFADGQTTFKRVFFESDDQGVPHLRLQPRNETYPPRVVAAEEVTGLYRALYRYERVDER